MTFICIKSVFLCIYCDDSAAAAGSGAFKQQPEQEPDWEKIKADQAVYLETALTVIPGTGIKKPEKAAGGVFHYKNQNGVNRSPKKYAQFFQIAGDDRNQGSQTVNGEHQQGSLADQPFVIGGGQILEAGSKKLHGPSDQTASDKVFPEIVE